MSLGSFDRNYFDRMLFDYTASQTYECSCSDGLKIGETTETQLLVTRILLTLKPHPSALTLNEHTWNLTLKPHPFDLTVVKEN